MQKNLKEVLATIPQQPQRQDGTTDQLRDLRAFAIRLGLQDADNLLRIIVERTDKELAAAR